MELDIGIVKEYHHFHSDWGPRRPARCQVLDKPRFTLAEAKDHIPVLITDCARVVTYCVRGRSLEPSSIKDRREEFTVCTGLFQSKGMRGICD